MTIRYRDTNKGRRYERPSIIPAIPLERPEKKSLTKGEYHTYKLRSTPSDNTSPTYELSVPYFSTGTPEEWLKFLDNIKKVYTGQNITTGPNRYSLCRRLLDGEALTVFEAEASQHTTETAASCEECLRAVTKAVLPARAVIMQRRYLRRVVRKPREMKTREWLARIHEINNRIPDMEPNQTKLTDEEMKEIAEYGIPRSFSNEMIRQQFNPINETIQDFILFCERLEMLEATNNDDDEQKERKNKSKGDKNKNKRRREDGRTDGRSAEKYCAIHGRCNHTTDECDVVKRTAKRLRGEDKDNHARRKGKYTSNSSSTKTKKEEFHAMVDSAVKKALKARIPKRKRDATSDELHAFNELDISESDSESVTPSVQSNTSSSSDSSEDSSSSKPE